MLIIAVDPGKGTGIAWYDTVRKTRFADEFAYAEVAPAIEVLISGAGQVRLVCEKYVMMPGLKSPQPDALMHMGAVEWIARRNKVPLTWQLPGPAKSTVPDARLRQLGWYTKTKDGHANDASRHVILWLAFNQPAVYADMIGI